MHGSETSRRHCYADRVHDQRHDLLHVVVALRLHHPVTVVPRLVDLAVSPSPSPAPAVLSTVPGPLLCSDHHVLSGLSPIVRSVSRA